MSSSTRRTPSGDLDEERLHGLVGYQLAQATVATDRVFRQQVGEPFGLRPVEYTLLTLIGDNPGGSSSSLAQALAVTAPNITMWIDRLVGRGLVRRRQSSTDRRKQELRLSAEGVRLVAQATDRLVEGERAALGGLSSAERAMLLELLHKVAQLRNS
ncbi:MAG: MarR family transcriptional regulator [Pseudomonadota bacterium]